MSGHTKGPWFADENGAVRGAGLEIVAVRHRLQHDIHAANARLIAAAPEMYEALKEARQRLVDGMESEGPLEHEWSGSDRKFVRQIDAAIAKAEGR